MLGTEASFSPHFTDKLGPVMARDVPRIRTQELRLPAQGFYIAPSLYRTC